MSKGPGAGRQAAQVNGGCMRLRDADRAPVDEGPELGSSDQLTGSRISQSWLCSHLSAAICPICRGTGAVMTAIGPSLCPVNQSLHKWNHLILTTGLLPPPPPQFTDASGMYLLGICYVPGTGLGPGSHCVCL